MQREKPKAAILQGASTEAHVGDGLPQGSVTGQVLANLYLHCVFDKWMSIQADTV
jgi:hypothetical protein